MSCAIISLDELFSGFIGSIFGIAAAFVCIYWQTREQAKTELRAITLIFIAHTAQGRNCNNHPGPTEVWSVREYQDRMISAFLRYRCLCWRRQRQKLDAAWMTIRGVGPNEPDHRYAALKGDDGCKRIKAMLDAIA